MSLIKSEFYGPGRQPDYRAIKELNWNGRVLRKGDYNLPVNSFGNSQGSSLDELFNRCKTDVTQEQKLIKQKQAPLDKSVMSLDEGILSYKQTSRDYGLFYWSDKPSKRTIDNEIHLVDFSPKYIKGNHGDLSSIYRYSYNQTNKSPSIQAKLTEIQDRSRNSKNSNFTFGTSNERVSTETNDCYNDISHGRHSPNAVNKFQHKSSIFKRGDWNVLHPTMPKTSMATDEFKISGQFPRDNGISYSFARSARNNFKDRPDYARTHIKIKQENIDRSTFCRKDYLVGIGGAIQKPPFSKAPPSASVIQRDRSPVGSSINKADYISYQDKLKDLDRSAESLQNKIKSAENHIRQGHENNSSSPQNLCTTTRSKYFKPRSDAMRLEHSKAPVTKYPVLGHYTEAPKPNDTKDVKQESEKVDLTKHENKGKLESKERRRENDRTHFWFGTDGLGRCTEHDTRFSKRLQLDPKVVAAGVTESAVNDFENEQWKEEDEILKTITKDDYKPVEARRLTSPQRRLINKLEKHPPKVMSSHLFHMDNTSSLASRTKMDFISPFQ